MRNIILITKREYLTQVKKKSFIILTVLTPLLIIAFGGLIGFMFSINKSTAIIEVSDQSGLFKDELKSTDDVVYRFISAPTEKSIKTNLETREKLSGILVIPKLEAQNFDRLEENTTLWVNDNIGFEAKKSIVWDLKSILQKQKIKALGLKANEMESITKKTFNLNVESINEDNKADTDLAFGVKTGLGMLLMYVTFMFILMYGVRVMRSVLEEKNNRVVEIIISSVKPFELMMGKIIGVTFVALTQFSIWIMMSVAGAVFFNASFYRLPMNLPSGEVQTGNTDPNIIISEVSHTLLEMNFPLIILVFILFFLLGYVFYSSIYAAIGSAVDNETETQQFTLIAVLPMMIGVYGSFSIINNPDGPMAFWLSIIPFTSPIAMVARIPYGVPAWQIAISLFLLLGAALLMVYAAGKIYRTGILMYGNKLSLKNLYKWYHSR